MSSSNSRKSDHSSYAVAAPMTQVDKLLLDTLTDAPPAAPPPRKTPDDNWRELVVAKVKKEIPDEIITLEDFLIRIGATSVEAEEEEKDDVKPAQTVKRRTVALDPLEKAAQQRHRRMIKNRESAARSRERKQDYQVELESIAARLEEENEILLKEKAERTKRRFNQLMEKVVPVVNKPKVAWVLRRVQSWEW